MKKGLINVTSPLHLQTLGLDVNLDIRESAESTDQFYPTFLRENFTNITAILDEFRTRLTNVTSITVIALISLYVLVFLIGLAGNLSIIYLVTKSKLPVQNRARNRVLINLCIADLLVIAICCPMTAYTSATKVWILGQTLCKVLSYLQGMAVTAGTLSLTILSLYRYIFIRYPILYKKLSEKYLLAAMITKVWVLAALVSLPMIFTRTVLELRLGSIRTTLCVEEWQSDVSRRAFTIITFLIVYVLPCGVLIICHSCVSCTLCTTEKSMALSRNDSRQRSFRCKSSCSVDVPPTPPNTFVNYRHSDIYSGYHNSKVSENQNSLNSVDRRITITKHGVGSRRRLANLLMGMTICFVICWLPYNITSFYVDLFPTPSVVVFLPFTLLLGHAHSAINPVVYWLMNRNAHLKIKDSHSKSSTKNKPAPIFLQFVRSKDSTFTSESICGVLRQKYTMKEFSSRQ